MMISKLPILVKLPILNCLFGCLLFFASSPAWAQTATLDATQLIAQPQINADRLIVDLGARIRAGDASARTLTPQQAAMLPGLRQRMSTGPITADTMAAWREFVGAGNNPSVDLNALIQMVLRESYLQQSEDLRHYADKVRHFNGQKQAIREELGRVATHDCRVEPCPPFQTNARALTTSFGSAFLTSKAHIAAYAGELQSQLRSADNNAQLANVDLQTALQRQQQALQMMSNISKQLHDAAMAIIRKIGG